MSKDRIWERLHPEKVKEMKRKDYAKHAEAYKARAAARYERLKNDAEFKKKMASRLIKWRERNWEHFLADAREYQRRNRKRQPELYRAKEKRKYNRVKADPERYKRYRETSRRFQRSPKGRHIKQSYRARRKKAIGHHTVNQWLSRVALYGWRCAYCKVRLSSNTLTKDHVIPLSKGGTDWASNLVPACQSCNARKKDRPTTDIG